MRTNGVPFGPENPLSLDERTTPVECFTYTTYNQTNNTGSVIKRSTINHYENLTVSAH